MAERRDRAPRLDQPREARRQFLSRPEALTEEAFGVLSEKFARYMGTAYFLIGMTIFVLAWVVWNLLAPHDWRFDEYPFIFLTLMLSLQASYAAPLILLAQNRQADRDRVMLEQDRTRDERNLADTEFLTREVAALRIAMRDNATRDFVRGELRDLIDEMEERGLVIGRVAPEDSDASDTADGRTDEGGSHRAT
ncbi:DUF1003 domain-containing protein [Knoellia sp. LjRoot47]|uniref:DUF1003 domain-containing protein n=1 Tax=Knoellia sp. LjRoot47 TaxID=3342330 RepID=UPI003ECD53C4